MIPFSFYICFTFFDFFLSNYYATIYTIHKAMYLIVLVNVSLTRAPITSLYIKNRCRNVNWILCIEGNHGRYILNIEFELNKKENVRVFRYMKRNKSMNRSFTLNTNGKANSLSSNEFIFTIVCKLLLFVRLAVSWSNEIKFTFARTVAHRTPINIYLLHKHM